MARTATTTKTYSGEGTDSIPVGATTMVFTMVGGGGGGTGGTKSYPWIGGADVHSGGGGGSGAKLVVTYNVGSYRPANTFSYSVGSKGVGASGSEKTMDRAVSYHDGTDGTATTVTAGSATFSAGGGGGGGECSSDHVNGSYRYNGSGGPAGTFSAATGDGISATGTNGNAGTAGSSGSTAGTGGTSVYSSYGKGGNGGAGDSVSRGSDGTDGYLSVATTVQYYTLTVNTSSGGGVIKHSGTTISSVELQRNQSYDITAVPNAGYHFEKWSDNVLEPTRTVKLTSSDATYTAIFWPGNTPARTTYGGNIFADPSTNDGREGLIEVTFYHTYTNQITIRTYPNQQITVPDITTVGGPAHYTDGNSHPIFIGWIVNSTNRSSTMSYTYSDNATTGTDRGATLTVSATGPATNGSLIAPGENISPGASITYYSHYIYPPNQTVIANIITETNNTTVSKTFEKTAENYYNPSPQNQKPVKRWYNTSDIGGYKDLYTNFAGLTPGYNVRTYGRCMLLSNYSDGGYWYNNSNYTYTLSLTALSGDIAINQSGWTVDRSETYEYTYQYSGGSTIVRYRAYSINKIARTLSLSPGIHIFAVPMAAISGNGTIVDNAGGAVIFVFRSLPTYSRTLATLTIGTGRKNNVSGLYAPSGTPTVQTTTTYFPSQDSNNGYYTTYSAPKGTAILLPTGKYTNTNGMFVGWEGLAESQTVYKPYNTFAYVGGISSYWRASYRDETRLIVFDYNAANVEGRAEGNQLAYIVPQSGTATLNGTATMTKDGVTYKLIGWKWANAPNESTNNSKTIYDKGVFFGLNFKMAALQAYMEMKAVWVSESPVNTPLTTVTFSFNVPQGATLPSGQNANNYSVGVDFNTLNTQKVALPIYNCTPVGYSIAAWNNNESYKDYVWYSMTSSTTSWVETFKKDLYNITIVYNGNGGSGQSNAYFPNLDIDSATITIGSNSGYADPTRLDYTFVGWNTSKADADSGIGPWTRNTVVSASALIGSTAPSGNTYTVTLYAAWTPNTTGFNLIYDSNCGGDVVIGISNVFVQTLSTQQSQDFYITTAVPIRGDKSWVFFGWADSANATTPTHPANSQLTLTRSQGETTTTKRIYACWYRWERNLVFSGGEAGVSGIPDPQVSYTNLESNATYIIPNTTPSLTGRVFDGWLGPNSTMYYSGNIVLIPPVKTMFGTDSGYSQIWYNGSTWQNSAIPTTLTAQWEGRYAQLVYNANGGEGAPASERYQSTSAATKTFTISPTIPTRQSYQFLGWDRDRKNTIDFPYTNGSFSPNTITVDYGSIVTLYAMWQHIIDQSGGTAQYDEYGALVSFDPDNIPTITVNSGTPYTDTNMIQLASFTLDDAPSFDTYTTYDYSTSIPVQNNLSWLFIGGQVMETVDETVYLRSYASITEFSVPGTYLIRLAGENPNGEDTEYFIKLIVNEGEVYGRSEPLCYLEKTEMTDSGLLSTTRLYLKHVTGITRSYKVSVNDTYIMTKPVRRRYVIDLGNVESYEVSLTRTNSNAIVGTNNPDTYTTVEWVKYLQNFTDVWQNSTYNVDYSEERKTGGYRFVYIPPDPTRFPVIDKNVYINGTISASYQPDRVSIKLPLIVSSMVSKKGQTGDPDGVMIRLCTLDPQNTQNPRPFWRTISTYVGMPVIIPNTPTVYDSNGNLVDCPVWAAVSPEGTDTFTPFQVVQWEDIMKFTTDNPNDTSVYLYPLRYTTSSYVILRPDPQDNEGPVGDEITLNDDTITIDHNGPISITAIGGGGGGGHEARITGLYVDSWGDLRGVAICGGGGGAADAETKSFVSSAPIVISSYSVGAGGEAGQNGSETTLISSTPSIGTMTVRGGEAGGNASYNINPLFYSLGILTAEIIKYLTGQSPGAGGRSRGGNGVKSNLKHTAWHWDKCDDGTAVMNRTGKVGIGGTGTPQGAGGGAAPVDIKIDLGDSVRCIVSCGGDGLNRELTNTGDHTFDENGEVSGKNGTFGGGGSSAPWDGPGKGGDGAIIIKCMGVEPIQ